MVVEYLETSMSKDLLGKFPDNSAYDFDYSQSSIWSPLVNRGLVSSSSSFGLSRKLAYDEEDINLMMGLTKLKKFSAKIKRKLTDTLFYNLQKYQKMKRKKKKKKSLDLSPVPIPSSNRLNSTSVTPRKVKSLLDDLFLCFSNEICKEFGVNFW